PAKPAPPGAVDDALVPGPERAPEELPRPRLGPRADPFMLQLERHGAVGVGVKVLVLAAAIDGPVLDDVDPRPDRGPFPAFALDLEPGVAVYVQLVVRVVLVLDRDDPVGRPVRVVAEQHGLL